MDAPADRDALISQFINFTQAGPEEVSYPDFFSLSVEALEDM
jgi:hypothetical protein